MNLAPKNEHAGFIEDIKWCNPMYSTSPRF